MVKWSIIAVCMVPVCAGLAGVFLPAFGWFPLYGKSDFTFDIIGHLDSRAGFLHSIWLSIFTALFSTFIAYWLCIFILIYSQHFSYHYWLRKVIAPLIAVPHVTMAVGILFLIQPSGWWFRIISPWLTGWQTPANLNIAPDLYGFSLVLGLVVKELPFLLLVGFAILKQTNISGYGQISRSLGYGPVSSWFHFIHPLIAVRLRLCVLIVLCFAVSVVDMALILAPSTPAPLAVKIFSWYQEPEIEPQFFAAAGSVYLLIIAAFCCGIWLLFGWGVGYIFRLFSFYGVRFSSGWRIAKLVQIGVLFSAALILLIGILGLLSAAIWAFADIWYFPNMLPQKWGVSAWENGYNTYVSLALNSFIIGFIVSMLALISAIIWLEIPHKPVLKITDFFIYVPLLLPQAGFLFGMQILIIWLNIDGLLFTVIWAHYLFVFPYILLTLGPIWRRFDIRYELMGASLGLGKLAILWRVKMPMLAVQIITAFSIGFAVSCALYLPTIFAGNGHFLTLTTEAVTLAANASRQALGIAAILQMLLPLIIFSAAGIYLKLRWRRYRYFRIVD